MASQWDYFLKNLGEWQGSFTQFSADGEVLKITPSVLFLEGLNENQTVRLRLRRFAAESEGLLETNIQEMVREYQSLGRDILFFETGAFSQGSIQLAPFTEFGAEFGFIAGHRRLRLVQLYQKDAHLSQITLIQERRAGTPVIEKPVLSVEQLLGEWQGEAITLYPDFQPSDTFSTKLILKQEQAGQIIQQLSFGTQTITSVGHITGQKIRFEQGLVPVQVLMLLNGASATSPIQIQRGHTFFLEAGWLIEPNLRHRIIRRYNEKGEWVSLTLIKEEKMS
jgi:hypothetical protein